MHSLVGRVAGVPRSPPGHSSLATAWTRRLLGMRSLLSGARLSTTQLSSEQFLLLHVLLILCNYLVPFLSRCLG